MNFEQSKKNKLNDTWISIILLITLLFFLNYSISKIRHTIDLTSDSKFTLSPVTINQLDKIISPVDIIITIPENNNIPKIIQKLLLDLNLVLKLFENSDSKFPIRIHKFNIDAATNSSELIQKYKITERNKIIAITPSGRKKTIYEFENIDESNTLDTTNIFRSKDSLAREKVWESGFYKNWKEVNNGVLEPSEFNGEKIILKSILEIASRKQKRDTAYFTRGHGEGSPSDINQHNGFSELRNIFENQNNKVSSVDLSTLESIPEDAKFLIVTSPKGTFQAQEISIIRDFINLNNGRLLVAFDPNEEISLIDRPALGFRQIFREWGIRCHDMLIYDPNISNFDVFTGDYYLRTYNKDQNHNITKNLKKGQYTIQSSRLRPVETIKSKSETFESKELLYSSKDSWAISSWTSRKMPPVKNDILDLEGPIPVIAVSEYKNEQNESYSSRGKIIVLGSSKILTNKKLKENSGNRLLCNNIVNWLSGSNELLDIEPQNLNLYILRLNKENLSLLFYSLAIIPISIALVGIFVGWLRKEL